jgi:hypothetical protein
LLSNIPFSIGKAFPHVSNNDLYNLYTFNFAYVPRVYIACLAIKLTRIRKAKPSLIKLLKILNVGVDMRKLAVTLWTLLLILHCIACGWGAAGIFNTDSNQNWITDVNEQDEDDLNQYITALYFGTATTLTIGYGDILP